VFNKFIILKLIGVTAAQLHGLHDYASSDASRLFSSLKNEIPLKCVSILSAKLDETHGTYTIEVQVMTVFQYSEYNDAEGIRHRCPSMIKGQTRILGSYYIQVPSSILNHVLNILGLLENELQVTETY
jgi:hypothetical protein